MSPAAAVVAAGAVGFGHAVLPDHWVPLAVLGRTRRYPLGRVARLSTLAAATHVLVSLVLGAVLIVIGLQFRSTVEHAQNAVVGGLLMVTGAGFLVLELSGRGHGHSHEHGHAHGHGHSHSHAPSHEHEHEHAHSHEHGHSHEHSHEHEHEHGDPAEHGHAPGEAPGHTHGRRGLLAVVVPFGAAASPDLTILPVFLAATATGAATALGALVAFAAVTVTTMVALTLLAAMGGYQIQAPWLDRWGNLFTAVVLLIIGLLVLLGVL